MLNNQERRWIYQHAYLPEHLPDYLEAISGAKPHLHSNYLCLLRKKHLVFIGYPLGNTSDDNSQAYHSACERFQPATVAIIAPEIWLPSDTFEKQPQDNYYRLNLPLEIIDPAVAYMVRRAERELQVTLGKFGKDHRRLVKDFLAAHDLTREQKYLFQHIHQYSKKSHTAYLLDARKENVLVAFTIVDMGSADYAFYLFNFRSHKECIPGASDLLFRKMVNLAQVEGKKMLNLGLGIHPGIRRFKEKWGGIPFLSYTSALVHRKPLDLGKLANKL
jgi:hypothetical protein